MSQNSIVYLKNFIENLAEYPGVYKMLDVKNQLLYIGKAKNLKQRLKNYLNLEQLSPRMQHALSQLNRIEIIITETEQEALNIEAQLIRNLQPKYNILLKQKKDYKFIYKNDSLRDFPSFAITQARELFSNGGSAKLFGPFLSSLQIKVILDLIYLNFQIRNCSDKFFKARSTTCIQYDLKRCSGPCVKKVSSEEYLEQIKNAELFLNGNSKELLVSLKNKMSKASEEQNFEQAIIYRDRLQQIENFYQTQSLDPELDGQYIVYFFQENILTITTNKIYGGNNYGGQNYFIEGVIFEEIEQVFAEFVLQLFLEIEPAEKIFCNFIPVGSEQIIASLQVLRPEIFCDDRSVKFIRPQKGKKYQILQNLLINAAEAVKIKLNQLQINKKNFEELQQLCNLFYPEKIETIEVFDNSHIGGSYSIGGVVVADREGFNRAKYRAYRIKSTQIADDYQMLREVLVKRFSARHQLPDLLIIDGGLGHLNVAKKILLEMIGHEKFNIIAIAKGYKRDSGDETIFLSDGSAIKLAHHDYRLHFLQRLRDEAHRFAIGKHKNLRDGSRFKDIRK